MVSVILREWGWNCLGDSLGNKGWDKLFDECWQVNMRNSELADGPPLQYASQNDYR